MYSPLFNQRFDRTSAATVATPAVNTDTIKELLTISNLYLLLALGFGTLLFSQLVSALVLQFPSALTLTAFALLLAQTRACAPPEGRTSRAIFWCRSFLPL